MTRFPLHGLYALTDANLMPDTPRLLSAVEAALQGGVRILQYRDKSRDQALRLEQASALQALCSRYQTPLLINDDIELAAQVGASGVHLGQSDATLARARQVLGPDAIIGITCHDQLDLARQATAGGADYVAFGAFFPSATKPGARPAPLSLLPRARIELNCPMVAIGGLSVDNAGQVIAAGADMIAVVHALFSAADIRARAEAFTQLFSEPHVQ